MFEKVNRSGLIIYLYYNRDAKKLQDYGDITYHSKKHRYLQLYVPTQEVEQLVGRLSKEKFIKKVRVCHIQELETPFVGNLYREENVIIEKVHADAERDNWMSAQETLEYGFIDEIMANNSLN